MGKLLVLMVVAFVDMVGLVMLLPLLPFYATHFGATASVVGVLISAFSVAQLVSARMWGQMAPGLASAALCMLVSVFAWRYLRESRELRRSIPSLTTPAPPRSSREAIWHVIARSGEPAPRLIWIYTAAIGAFYGTAPILPLLMSERLGITEDNIGYFVMYLGGMGVVVRALILGRMVDWLREARLCRLGLVLLAVGLGLVSTVHSYPVLWASLTLMPLGTAFIFPCVTGLLSQVVSSNERGLFLSVQQTFGGVSRVAFPVGAGFLMDGFGRASPYWLAGVLVLATLALTTSMEEYLRPRAPAQAQAATGS